MNPNSGPGSSANHDYLQVIDYCHAVGHRVIGYVHTSYGTRPLATVKAEVDAYYGFYPTIDGIFVDEMSNEPSTVAYYESVYAHAHTRAGTQDVVGNPGAAAVTEWQLQTPVVDELVVFEGTASSYLSWTPPQWVFGYVASMIANLIFAASDEDTVRRVRSHSREVNAGYLYVTHGTTPNPWATFAAGAPARG